VVPEKEIVSILRSGEDPDTICGSLIDAANKRGGKDNISAVLVVIDEPEEPQDEPEIAEVLCGVPEKISETRTVTQAAETCREVPAATAEPVPEDPQKG
ncbi:MAG: hypothetical protein IKG59_04510, partial [Firmicutes bacterium]|nr:hypothetical protein [Bacillota bacterium]